MDFSASDSASPNLRVINSDVPIDWERIYRDNVVSIYRIMYSKVGNQADAEDLTSQVFLGALPHISTNASSGEIHGYLLSTARTTLADHWRRRLGHPVTVIDDNLHVPTLTESHSPDPLPRIRRILAMLPANYRRILELRFLEQRPVRDAAAVMGISSSNARVLQYRALRRAAEVGEEVRP